MNPEDPRAPATYRSVCRPFQHEIVIEKSRFITFIRPLTSEEEARAFVDEVREAHRDANHVVPAWIIGPAGLLMRASDDGEPQGTAGVPTLEVLRKEKLTDVAVATVRYFGGVKLGAGGLIRAYTRAVAEALAAGGTAEISRQRELKVRVAYDVAGVVDYRLAQSGWTAEKVYDSAVTYRLTVPDDLLENMETFFAGVSAGKAEVMHGAQVYAPTPEGSPLHLNDA